MQAQRISLSGACRAALSRSSASATMQDHPACGEAAPARGSRPLPHRRDPSHDSAPDSAPVADDTAWTPGQRTTPSSRDGRRVSEAGPSVTESEREEPLSAPRPLRYWRRAQVACARFLHTGHRCVGGRAPRNGAPGEPHRRSVDVTTMAITRRGFLRTAVAARRGAGAPHCCRPCRRPVAAACEAEGEPAASEPCGRDVKLSRPPARAGFQPWWVQTFLKTKLWPSPDETMEPLETVDRAVLPDRGAAGGVPTPRLGRT